jgi:membrane protein YqaA with SNARE-associated domain
MMRKLYDWMMHKAASDRAPEALGVVSFVESSFFPIPPDVMLIPMVLARREKAFWYATIATVTSVLGGMLGYAIGYYLYDAVGLPILRFYGKESALDGFIQFVGQRAAYCLAVTDVDAVRFVDVGTQIPVAAFFHILHVVDFHAVFLRDRKQKFFRLRFVCLSF